jgi:hypothetical protein
MGKVTYFSRPEQDCNVIAIETHPVSFFPLPKFLQLSIVATR